MADLAAGIIVGIVALPLSMALAISVGLNPVVGLYTAATAGLVAAIFSGAHFNVSGPAAAMVPILAGIYISVGKDFSKLQYIGFLAGIFLLVFGLLRIGQLIKHVPHAVTVGFTAGIALTIFLGQIPSFLGLSKLGTYDKFHDKTWDTIQHLGTTQWAALLIGVIAILLILYTQKVKPFRKIPSTLVAVVVTTLLVKFMPLFENVKTISDKFGDIPAGLPLPSLMAIQSNFNSTGSFIIPALKIAFLISIESLLCAVVADKLSNNRHRSNQELVAQGIGNLTAPLFGGFASTAVIARTGTIVKSGAKSRVAAMIHALIIIIFIVALSPIAGSFPLPALSAILLVTAWRISERKEVQEMLRNDNAIVKITLILTFLLTVFTDLTIGVGVGVVFYYFAKGITHEARVLPGESFDEDAIADPDELEEAGVDEDRPHGKKSFRPQIKKFFNINKSE